MNPLILKISKRTIRKSISGFGGMQRLMIDIRYEDN
jgi:hypothetical protein